MDEPQSDDQWGGWLMADVALVLVFLLLAGTAVGRAGTPEPDPTPIPTATESIQLPLSETPTAEPIPTVTITVTPSVQAVGMDPASIRIEEIAGSAADLPRVSDVIAARIREESGGRKPAMLLVFGTAFKGKSRTSGGEELSRPVIERLAAEFTDPATVFREFHWIPGTHGLVAVDVYYYQPEQ